MHILNKKSQIVQNTSLAFSSDINFHIKRELAALKQHCHSGPGVSDQNQNSK